MRLPIHRFLRSCAMSLLLAAASGCCYRAGSPLPSGLSYESSVLPATDARFLYDQTAPDEDGTRVYEQRIFDEAFSMIRHARRLVVIDMFLLNDFLAAGPAPHRRLCEELTDTLIDRKREVPDLRVILITDPINTVYGGQDSPYLTRLRKAGVEVVLTQLDALRDSNPLWSSFWRIWAEPFGNSATGGWLANPFGDGKVTLRSWLALLNFKANHRKVLIADQDDDLCALVTSANPHDGSSAHSNVGVVLHGLAARKLLKTEAAVLAFSAERPILLDALSQPDRTPDAVTSTNAISIQVLTEGAIARNAERMIGSTGPGDALDLVMFYLSDRRIIRALKTAAQRGVILRVTLDPNKDAFGREKNGMPNRQTAHELVAAGIPVRWAVTQGEQMHTKLLLVRRRDGLSDLLLGSANFTRRNLRDYNLETDIRLTGPATTPVLRDAARYAERLWTNADGRRYTVDYPTFQDNSLWRVFRYRLQEATGLCTW